MFFLFYFISLLLGLFCLIRLAVEALRVFDNEPERGLEAGWHLCLGFWLFLVAFFLLSIAK